MPYIDQFFQVLIDSGASDLHLGEGQPPKIRLPDRLTVSARVALTGWFQKIGHSLQSPTRVLSRSQREVETKYD